ncbi:MAG: DNA polymerase Y family protein [Oceanococcaceae bacterium]
MQETLPLGALAWQFSPRVSLITPATVVFEVGGCLRLFGGLRPLLKQLDQQLSALPLTGPKPVMTRALAPYPRAALVLARAGQPVCIHRRQALTLLLDSMPVTALFDGDLSARLARVGVHTLGQCRALPAAGFRKRYGVAAAQLISQVYGEVADPMPAYVPQEQFVRRLDCEDDIRDADSILHRLQPALRELLTILRRDDGSLVRLILSLQHPRGQQTPLTMGLQRPSREVAHWNRMLGEHLHRLPLPGPVRSLTVEGQWTAISGDVQQAFWTDKAIHERPALIDRLQARLGHEAVYSLATRARHVPEYAMQAAAPGAGGHLAPEPRCRPTWLLLRPRIFAADSARPGWQGPERIETGWWGEDQQREYFRVRGRDGQWHWIYQDPLHPGRWFEHGLFG